MRKKQNRGLTLIEMLISLSLMVIVMLSVITMFSYPNKVYNHVVLQSRLQDKVDLALIKLAKDIRSATKPDSTTNAIVIYDSNGNISSSGNMMHIYSYDSQDNMYYKVSYRYKDGFLYRDSTSRYTASDIKAAVLFPQMSILDNVVYPSDGDLFQDITDESGDHSNDRRTILVNLIVRDEEGNLFTPMNMPKAYSSRTISSP